MTRQVSVEKGAPRLYVRQSITRSFNQAWKGVIGETATQRVIRALGGISTLAVSFVYVESFNRVGSEFSDATKASILAAAALVVVFAVVLATNLVFVVPYQLWRDERERADQAEQALQGEIASKLGVISDRAELTDCLLYSIFREWGHSEKDLSPEDAIRFLGDACRHFEQLARDGSLVIWGRNQHSGPLEELPRAVWSEQQIERLSVFAGRAETENRLPQPNAVREYFKFHRLMARKSDVERIFPARA